MDKNRIVYDRFVLPKNYTDNPKAIPKEEQVPYYFFLCYSTGRWTSHPRIIR
jgi:hypothetical protein